MVFSHLNEIQCNYDELMKLNFDNFFLVYVEIPGNSLPFLSIDGFLISQSMAINRHLARTFGKFVLRTMYQYRINLSFTKYNPVLKKINLYE